MIPMQICPDHKALRSKLLQKVLKFLIVISDKFKLFPYKKNLMTDDFLNFFCQNVTPRFTVVLVQDVCSWIKCAWRLEIQSSKNKSLAKVTNFMIKFSVALLSGVHWIWGSNNPIPIWEWCIRLRCDSKNKPIWEPIQKWKRCIDNSNSHLKYQFHTIKCNFNHFSLCGNFFSNTKRHQKGRIEIKFNIRFCYWRSTWSRREFFCPKIPKLMS